VVKNQLTSPLIDPCPLSIYIFSNENMNRFNTHIVAVSFVVEETGVSTRSKPPA